MTSKKFGGLNPPPCGLGLKNQLTQSDNASDAIRELSKE